ncbi:MAG: 50S ribosomal protein L13 [Bradymonadales bacterium]|nr:MAG: 50S ribosomal protein L13 [Bradymonadales bacterium]
MKTYLLDASLVPVGRLATVAASLLSGKHKPSFTPGANSGDQVVVINANRAFFSSNKAEKKIYYWHTGWMGGLKMRTAGEALERNPERVIFEAVEGMLPKNRLSQRQLVHLKIYKTADHPHQAQKPYALTEEHFGLKKLGLGD